MSRDEAKKLAETVSLEDLKQMFLNAQSQIKDWTTASRVNKGLSLGVTFNIFTAGFEKYKSANEIFHIGRTNMIWAFGEYLPGYTKPVQKTKSEIKVAHQEPKLFKP
jgi:hypothetical protein